MQKIKVKYNNLYVCTFKKWDKKCNIATDAGHFLKTEIDSTDLKNENLTTKIRRNKAEKPYCLKKLFQDILKQTKPSNKISTPKNIAQRNISNKIAKNSWLSSYKGSRSNKINYIFVTQKNVRKKKLFLQMLGII